MAKTTTKKTPAPPPAPQTWSERQFAERVGSSTQNVGRARREAGLPHIPAIVNGKPAFRYDTASLDWWRKHRGETGNTTGHGGKREGGGRPRREESGKRKVESGNQDSGAKTPARAEHSGSTAAARAARLRHGEALLRDIYRDGEPDLTLVHLLALDQKKELGILEKAKRLSIDRQEHEATLTRTAQVRHAIAEKVRSASAVLDAMPSRIAATLARELGLDEEQRTRAIELVREDVERTREAIGSGAGGTHAPG